MTSALRPAVVEAFPGFSVRFEGRVLSMYLDILGLVTIGVGNLIDTVGQAVALPFIHEKTGQRATPAEIAEAWRTLKARKDLAKLHYKYAAALNDLRLTEAAVDDLVRSKLESNAAYITSKHYPRFPEFPADAQLAIMSMAWAVGPGFPVKFGNFSQQVGKQDWLGAKACCKIREAGNPGVVPRNRANELCLDNAHTVAANGLDPSELNWPAIVIDPVEITRPDIPSLIPRSK